MEKLAGPYGMFGTVYGISTPVIHVAHPIPAKAILTGSSSISRSIVNSTGASKAPAYNHFKNFFGNGVFTADGKDWKAKRTAVIHCLIKGTTSSTSEMSQRLEKEANRAADIFCYQIQSLKKRQQTKTTTTTSDHRCDDCVVVSTNIVPLLQRATIGLIYRYITHADPEWLLPANILDCKINDDSKNDNIKETVTKNISLSSSVDEIDTNISGVAETSSVTSSSSSSSSLSSSCSSSIETRSLLNTYLSSIIRIRMIVLAQSRSIWFLLPRWCYRHFSSLYRDEETTLGPIREFAKQACTDARPESPLRRLCDSSGSLYSHVPYSGQFNQTSSSCNTISNNNLLNEAITILFAGQDTSAATLSWTLHLLSLYPKAQERLAKEVREVLNIDDNCSSRTDEEHPIKITRKDISKLPYLDAVIKESMRLYPVAPFVVRRLTEEICIPSENSDDIVSLPAGSVACLWIYSLHRNPKLWNRPNDFIPERWLDITLKDPGQTNGGYIPYAMGPRNCLGQPLARIILRTILAKLVYQYKFTDVRLRTEDDAIDLRKEMQAGFTVLPTGGVNLEICSRTIENSKIN
jgi:cytochrome P450